MIRAPLGDLIYWDKWVEFGRESIDEYWERISKPSKNPGYRPQYVFNFTKNIIFYYIV